jgi:predicted metallopeptidase
MQVSILFNALNLFRLLLAITNVYYLIGFFYCVELMQEKFEDRQYNDKRKMTISEMLRSLPDFRRVHVV